MGMSIRFCIGIFTVIAMFAASVIGSAAAMGEAKAIARFAGISGWLESNWRELMSFGPVGCALIACLGWRIGSVWITRQIATGWTRFPIVPGTQTMKEKSLTRLMPSQVELGVYDTSPAPRGKHKQFWIMRLRMLPGRNRLPRGFNKLPLFV